MRGKGSAPDGSTQTEAGEPEGVAAADDAIEEPCEIVDLEPPPGVENRARNTPRSRPRPRSCSLSLSRSTDRPKPD